MHRRRRFSPEFAWYTRNNVFEIESWRGPQGLQRHFSQRPRARRRRPSRNPASGGGLSLGQAESKESAAQLAFDVATGLPTGQIEVFGSGQGKETTTSDFDFGSRLLNLDFAPRWASRSAAGYLVKWANVRMLRLIAFTHRNLWISFEEEGGAKSDERGFFYCFWRRSFTYLVNSSNIDGRRRGKKISFYSLIRPGTCLNWDFWHDPKAFFTLTRALYSQYRRRRTW